MPSTYWIAIGDVHNDTAKLAGINDLAGAAGVIVSGDLTFLGGTEDAQQVLHSIAGQAKIIAAQIGNMDKPEVTGLLQKQSINLHGKAIKVHPALTLIGVGGSNKTPFNTPSEFSEDEIAALLQEALSIAGDYENLILVAHTPPLNTECDRLANGGHAGSSAVREFIEKVQPAVCLCGHIHEARGMDMIGNTPIINTGAFADGGYAKISLENDALEVALLLAE